MQIVAFFAAFFSVLQVLLLLPSSWEGRCQTRNTCYDKGRIPHFGFFIFFWMKGGLHNAFITTGNLFILQMYLKLVQEGILRL